MPASISTETDKALYKIILWVPKTSHPLCNQRNCRSYTPGLENTPCTWVQYSEILLLRLCLQNPTTQSAGERYEYVLQHKQEVHCCDDHRHTIQNLQHSPKHFSALCHSNANNPTHANTLESTIHLCIRVKLWVLVKIHFCTVSHSCRNSTSDCVKKDTHIWWWHHHIF